MEALVGLFLMLLGVSHGVETSCDARQNGTQCYGALGGTVSLQLMDSASEIFRYSLTKKPTVILNGRKDPIVIDVIENRFSFTPSNGTFRINELIRTDGGEYELETFNSNGKPWEQRTLQLTIQAPVSSVLLVHECLSQGEMKVSCSSEGGDSPQYSWTLNGHSLTDAELLSGKTDTNSITLKQHVSGRLGCSVRNNVNSVFKENDISTCGFIFIDCILLNGTYIAQWVFEANNTLQCIEPTTTPATSTETSTAGKETGTQVSTNPCTNITSTNQNVTPTPGDEAWHIKHLPLMAGVLSVLVLLLVVGVAVVCAHKKKQRNKAKEEDQELTYADVQFAHRPERQMQQRAETEVEYGQVKFAERSRQSVKPAEDECVYAKVRKGR